MQLPKFLKWFRRSKSTAKPPKFFSSVVFVEQISAIPDLTGRIFYIVKRQGRPLWAVFECPCETGHILRVNLSRNQRPYWSVSTKRDLVSLSPSIWLKDFCNGHYWIQESKVYWAFSARK